LRAVAKQAVRSVESIHVPSQRLLKMMDPLGHLTTSRRVLASSAHVAVVWARSARIASWIAAELRSIGGVGIEPLRATSFRHVHASLRMESPPCALAVLEWSAVSAADVAVLTTARWAGYRGPIIAVAAPGAVSRETQAVIRVDAVVSPEDRAGDRPLREVAARLLGIA
jgi:hypothetical protein